MCIWRKDIYMYMYKEGRRSSLVPQRAREIRDRDKIAAHEKIARQRCARATTTRQRLRDNDRSLQKRLYKATVANSLVLRQHECI